MQSLPDTDATPVCLDAITGGASSEIVNICEPREPQIGEIYRGAMLTMQSRADVCQPRPYTTGPVA